MRHSQVSRTDPFPAISFLHQVIAKFPRNPDSPRSSLLVLILLFRVLPINADIFYSNNFAQPPSSEWSPRTTSVSPADQRRFLGRFGGQQSASLRLGDLPPHTEISISFDLLIIGTWDGSGDADLQSAPDTFTITIDDKPSLMRASFLNTFLLNKNSGQSFPASVSNILYEGRTGAVENNVLGYSWNGYTLDSVYHLAFTVPHTNDQLHLTFVGGGLSSNLSDESWGLDNFTLYAGLAPPILLSQPTSQFAHPGGSATFSVRAAGSVPLSYNWLFNETPVPGATNSILTLTNVAQNLLGYTLRGHRLRFLKSSENGRFPLIVSHLTTQVSRCQKRSL